MEQINEDKQVFSDLFDKIDPDDNGDVDELEWISGLKRLNVDIAESDMGKLFKLMDGDKSGYIDRQDWITLCMTSYQSTELQRLHDSVISHMIYNSLIFGYVREFESKCKLYHVIPTGIPKLILLFYQL